MRRKIAILALTRQKRGGKFRKILLRKMGDRIGTGGIFGNSPPGVESGSAVVSRHHIHSTRRLGMHGTYSKKYKGYDECQ